MSDDLSRLRWLCRRGMKELDVVLTHYLERSYLAASDDEQQAFEQLLEWQDPAIFGLLLGREHSDDAALNQLVKRLVLN